MISGEGEGHCWTCQLHMYLHVNTRSVYLVVGFYDIGEEELPDYQPDFKKLRQDQLDGKMRDDIEQVITENNKLKFWWKTHYTVPSLTVFLQHVRFFLCDMMLLTFLMPAYVFELCNEDLHAACSRDLHIHYFAVQLLVTLVLALYCASVITLVTCIK